GLRIADCGLARGRPVRSIRNPQSTIRNRGWGWRWSGEVFRHHRRPNGRGGGRRRPRARGWGGSRRPPRPAARHAALSPALGRGIMDRGGPAARGRRAVGDGRGGRRSEERRVGKERGGWWG